MSNYYNNNVQYCGNQNMNNIYQFNNNMNSYQNNIPYMNQMNFSNNSFLNQNTMNNNSHKSKSYNAYFSGGRFLQNHLNNGNYFNNNTNQNFNNINTYNNNISNYNNIGTMNNSNNFNNNIATFNNNMNNFNNNISTMNNINNFNNNNFGAMNNVNNFNNINTMNNMNNTNNFNNNINNINNICTMNNAYYLNNNINNNNNSGNVNANMKNIFNPKTVIQKSNFNNKMGNAQPTKYKKRPSKIVHNNKNTNTYNISTYKEDNDTDKKEKYSKRNIEQKVPNDIKKESSKNIETNKNVAENKSDKTNANIDISNPNKQLQQSEKADLEQKDIIEEKPFEEEDLKLNALIKARGLENVGATCYMNSTLQCLYHVKQLSESLVNDDKIDEKLELTYSFKKLIEGLAFTNIRKFKIDRKYNRVTGENIKSFKPENFKEVLSKKNPLFKGIKANDSKDLIMYLFQEMDKELTLRNNNSEKMEMFIGNDESDTEKENFKKFHNSIFSDLFYGFQKSDMICYDCRNCNSTYNVFNNLILPIEKTYNSLNDENKKKNRNNNVVNMFNIPTCQTFNRRPVISASVNYNYGYNNNYNNFNNTPDLPRKLKVYDCLKEMLKDEILSGDNQIYCNKCRRMCNSINRTRLYKTPNILVLILNRGKGNSFECEIKFSSNEILDLSRYNIISPDSPTNYKLFGVISHIGESSDEGHFIAYCKHFDDNWYMFNDSIAKTVGEDELTNGVPYILFYRNINIDKEF